MSETAKDFEESDAQIKYSLYCVANITCGNNNVDNTKNANDDAMLATQKESTQVFCK